jgi:hypothetical protein
MMHCLLLACLAGMSGSCALYAPDQCCIGIASYAVVDPDVCAETCENYWSPIMPEKPLNALWKTMQYQLPNANFTA